MDLSIVKKYCTMSSIVAFVVGLVVMGLIWIVSLKVSVVSTDASITVNPPLIPAEVPVMLSNKSMKSPTTSLNKSGIERSLSWDAATNLITTAPIEKLEVKGLTLKIFMKGGSIFTTTQPKADAYVNLIKRNPEKIQIVK